MKLGVAIVPPVVTPIRGSGKARTFSHVDLKQWLHIVNHLSNLTIRTSILIRAGGKLIHCLVN